MAHFTQPISDIRTVKKSTKASHIARSEHFKTGREIDKEVFDGFLHAEEVGNNRFDTFLIDRLVEDKKSFFEPFSKAWVISGNEKRKKFLKLYHS